MSVKSPVRKPRKKYWQKKPGRGLSVKDGSAPSYGKKEPAFLTLADAVKIHTDQIANYGGTDGIRDMSLLQSALAQPEASFGGDWLHADLFEMAAAYAFHICQNHPFFDGNKRTAFVAAIIFLEINGIAFTDPREILLETMLEVAEGKIGKKELARIFRSLPGE